MKLVYFSIWGFWLLREGAKELLPYPADFWTLLIPHNNVLQITIIVTNALHVVSRTAVDCLPTESSLELDSNTKQDLRMSIGISQPHTKQVRKSGVLYRTRGVVPRALDPIPRAMAYCCHHALDNDSARSSECFWAGRGVGEAKIFSARLESNRRFQVL